MSDDVSTTDGFLHLSPSVLVVCMRADCSCCYWQVESHLPSRRDPKSIIFRSRSTRSRPIELPTNNERTTRLAASQAAAPSASSHVSARKWRQDSPGPAQKSFATQPRHIHFTCSICQLGGTPSRVQVSSSHNHAAKAGRPSRAWPQTSHRRPSARTLLGSASP